MTYPLEPVTHVSTRRFPWWIPLVVGVLVAAAGIGLLIWPFVAATWILVILFGSALIANGLALTVRLRPSASTTVGGVLLILAGILAIVFSEFTVSALVTFVGVSLIFVGALWLVIGIRLTEGASMLVLLPTLLTLLGGVVTLIWPDFAIKVVAVVCGLFTVMLGTSLIWTAIRLRKISVSQTTIILD
ncbi:DUF308 domain-containing protein [Leucobacter sp. W1038]|uniref:DUF308 domain-containing protein n=1 Tax=Leucobacter sp. W1038 TaxID=3438281 RepID=UPI003D98CCFA